MILPLLISCGPTSKTTANTFCLTAEGIRYNQSDRQPSLICPIPKSATELINPRGCVVGPRIRSKTQRGIDRNNAKVWCCTHRDESHCKVAK
jgi:hypothetical protein